MPTSLEGLTTLPKEALLEELIAVIDRDGGVIVRDFLDAQARAHLKDEIDAAMLKVGTGETPLEGRALFAKCPTMVKVALHPLYLGAVRAILQRRPFHAWVGQTRQT